MTAQASLLAALMFYTGVLYTSAYYGYFQLSPLAIGFTFPELVIQSLRLVSRPLLIAVAAALLIFQLPEVLSRFSAPAALALRHAFGGLARCHALITLAGLMLLLAWRPLELRGWGWLAPVTLAAGLLLGQTRAGNSGRRPSGLLRHAVPVFAAGLFGLWATALIAGQLGRADAHYDAAHVVDRTAVVVFSADSLMLSPHSELHEECLPDGVRTVYRCRYLGLRLLVVRDGRYHLVPARWRRGIDPVYVLSEGVGLRVELLPGTR